MLLSVLLSALFDLLSGDCRYLGALCVMMAAVHIDKGRLSFCFKSLGNIVRCLFGVASEFVRDCFGVCSVLLKDVYALRGTFHHCLRELSLIWQSLMTDYV